MDEHKVTAGQRRRADELVQLAMEEFGRLLPGEVKMLRGAAMGEGVNLAEPGNVVVTDWVNLDQIDHLNNFGAHRKIRAFVLRWLCSFEAAKQLVNSYGVQLNSALVLGELDLDAVVVAFQLGFGNCAFPDGIRAQDAQFLQFGMYGCFISSFNGDRMRIKGNLFFRHVFVSSEGVRMAGASIDGSFECVGAHFASSNGVSLNLHKLSVRGGIFLSRGFKARGLVNLQETTIGGNLDCTDGSFYSGTKCAINATRIIVTGEILFCGKFRANSGVWLRGANIGGSLICTGGKFSCKKGVAFKASNLSVSESVYLNNGFQASSEVRLIESKIGRNLYCDNGRFEENGTAIFADRVNVSGNIFMGKNFYSQGNVLFAGSTVGNDIECFGHFCNALDLSRAVVGGRLFYQPVMHDGGLDLLLTKVKYYADYQSALPKEICLSGFEYDQILPESVGTLSDRLNWLNLHDITYAKFSPFVQQPYKELAKSLRSAGLQAMADQIMFEAKKKHARAEFAIMKSSAGGLKLAYRAQWIWSMGYEKFSGYGYKRWNPLKYMSLFILMGGVVFSSFDLPDLVRLTGAFPHGMQPTQGVAIQDGYPSDTENSEWLEGYPIFRPIAYSADTFLPFVDLHQENYWTPKDRFLKQVYLPIHILLGWLTTTYLVTLFTNLIRHEKE